MLKSFVTAALDRPLSLPRRPDLVIREQWYRGERHFVVKDPVAVRYVYLSEHEYFVLALLNGEMSIASIVDQFRERFAPLQVSAGQLRSFVSQLHQSELVLSDAPGQGEQLHLRRMEKHRFRPLRLAEQMLSLRWRGIDPEPLLAWFAPLTGWFFSWVGMGIWLATVVVALVLAITRWDGLAQRLPDLPAWLSGSNLPWLIAATILIKALHELGHAVMARRMGCRVSEIGLQLFFFLPCIYTNVTDVWLIPNKWRRIAVSVAGIYVELFLAAIAMLVWWQAEPGVLSSLCLNIMLVSSVGTVLLNGNPLMRYDGYYVLSDLIEVPNLEERSRIALVEWLGQCCTGASGTSSDGLMADQRPLLAMYAAAALAYRSAVLLGLYLAARALLKQVELQPLADVFFAAALVGIIAPLMIAAVQHVRAAQRRRELRPWRLAISGMAAAAILAGVALIPLPQRVATVAVIEARDASPIYVTVAGNVQDAIASGTMVRQGDVLARLDSPELRRDLLRLTSQAAQQELHIIELETTRSDDPAAAAAIPTARQSLADLSARIAQVRELTGRLEVKSNRDGQVLPPLARPTTIAEERQLAAWSGSPLDPANRGCYLETGTLLCQISTAGLVEATAIVDQADLPLVQPGAAVLLAMPLSPWRVIRGTVEEVAQRDADSLPPSLANNGLLPQETGPDGQRRPLQRVYQVRVRLDEAAPGLLPGATGRARIVAQPQTFAARIRRWFAQTFRFVA